MGVTVSAVIEYKISTSYFAFSNINIPRSDELLPSILYGDGGVTDEMLFPPRGMPSDFSSKVADLFFTDLETVENYLKETQFDGEDEITPEEYLEDAGEWAVEQYKTSGLLPTPELYSPSWLALNELQEVMMRDKIAISSLTPEFRAIVAAMNSLAQDFGTDNVRLIFWCGM